MEIPQRPALFANLIKDPPPNGPEAPISSFELAKIDKYVRRAHDLKGACWLIALSSLAVSSASRLKRQL